MGRWAQRQRRATPSESPPPAPVTLIEIHGNGTSWSFIFDGPIELVGLFSDGTVQIDDSSFSGPDAPPVGAIVDAIADQTAGYGAGLPWSCPGQPTWLLTPLAGASSGTTT